MNSQNNEYNGYGLSDEDAIAIAMALSELDAIATVSAVKPIAVKPKCSMREAFEQRASIGMVSESGKFLRTTEEQQRRFKKRQEDEAKIANDRKNAFLQRRNQLSM